MHRLERPDRSNGAQPVLPAYADTIDDLVRGKRRLRREESDD
jgi:hypothetical protein